MQLNLTKFLAQVQRNQSCGLIHASEECAPLVLSLSELCRANGSGYSYRNFNVDRYFNLNTIKELLNNLSLFGEVYFIELNFKTKPTQDQQDQLLKILPLLADNFLLLVCDKLEKKEYKMQWLQAIDQLGFVLGLSGDYEESRVWANYLLKKSGLTISNSALNFMLEMNQNNLTQLQQELNKLSLMFNSSAQITLDDAKNNLIDNAQFNVFALANAYLHGDSVKANKIFDALAKSSESLILIMWQLGEDIRKLIRIKSSLKKQMNFQQAIEGLRIWGDGVLAFQKANQRISYQILLEYLDALATIDCMLKGIKTGDAAIYLKRVIINFCQGQAYVS